jgi:ribose-phosphate pyrophosphokinase
VNHKLQVFSGNANPELATSIATHLNLKQGNAFVGRFSDGEIRVEILENVRGSDVFIVQPTCAPCNDNLMELLIMADAMRRASASRVTAVVPYFGYARQDRRVRSARVPISAKVVADMLTSVGINRLITVDLHADQIQGFFHFPVDNVYASSVLLNEIKKINEQGNLTIVSPDVGGVVRARAIAKRIPDAQLAIIDKRRPQPNESEVMQIIGDVKGRHCVIVDDIVDTAGTLCAASDALKKHGALSVTAFCTHPVLSGNAVEKIERSLIDKLIVTDTIPLREDAKRCSKIMTVSLGDMLSQVIRRVNEEESLSCLFPE